MHTSEVSTSEVSTSKKYECVACDLGRRYEKKEEEEEEKETREEERRKERERRVYYCKVKSPDYFYNFIPLLSESS